MMTKLNRTEIQPGRSHFQQCVIGAVAMLFLTLSTAARGEFADFRAMWVSRFEYSTSSPSSVRSIMNNAASLGITDVLFQVRGEADAYYDSNFDPRSERLSGTWDPLQTAVDAAHENGMRLHAWINAMPIWRGSAQPLNPDHIFFNEDPSFRRMNSSGVLENPLDSGSYPINGEYASVNPILPEVHTHISNVVNDIATNYTVDGVHLDYIRWIGSQSFGTLPHDDQSHEMFMQATGLDGSDSTNSFAYRTFIKDRITDLIGTLKGTIDAAEISTGRSIDLSAAVWRDPDIAENERLQDYRTWLEGDLLDIAMPMIYLSSSNDNLMLPNLLNTLTIPSNTRVAPGLGVYLHDANRGGADLTITQLQRLYDNGADGATVFSYSSFFGSDPLASARRTAVQDFYAEISDPGTGTITPDATILVDFEQDEGTFNLPPTFSGSTTGVDDATAERTTDEKHIGIRSQMISIDGTGTDPWLVRHLSGVGDPNNNLELAAAGFLGFWLKTAAPGLEVSVVVDDPGTGERGLVKSVAADNEWHLYEWDLGNDTEWEAWIAGDGAITDPTTTLDSIQFFGSGDAVIYLDSIAHNPLGRLLAPILPGDYDGNGVVEVADYNEWKATVGQIVNPGEGADGNADGIVSLADYTVWRDHLGATIGSQATQIPEPAAWLHFVVVSVTCVLLRRSCIIVTRLSEALILSVKYTQ